MRPVHVDDVPETRRDVGEVHSAWRDLSTAAGGDRLGIQRVVADPGCRSTAPHVHADSEEVFVVLEGDGLLWRDGATHEIREGDVIVHRVREEVHAMRAGRSGLTVLACGPRPANLTWWPRIGGGRIGAGTTPAFAGTPWDYEETTAGPLAFAAPTPRPPTVVALDEVPAQRHDRGGSRFTVRDAGRAAGCRRTGLRVQDIDPGALGYPPHCHSHDEEQFVVLAGGGELWLDDERHAVRTGSVVVRPAGTGVAHAFAAGEEGLRVLAYGTREPGDMAYHPRSGNLQISGLGIVGRLRPVDFWDGEAVS
jgi:uncharacterized cupin superfamily protein